MVVLVLICISGFHFLKRFVIHFLLYLYRSYVTVTQWDVERQNRRQKLARLKYAVHIVSTKLQRVKIFQGFISC
jgi:hypothetical protein